MQDRRYNRTAVCRTAHCQNVWGEIRGGILTKRRNVAKQKQNMRGPARSASSIMRSSTRRKGFRTVMDLAPM